MFTERFVIDEHEIGRLSFPDEDPGLVTTDVRGWPALRYALARPWRWWLLPAVCLTWRR